MVDWSSLPSDLIRGVADCFLVTNDIDYYMDMRAVCCSWRTAMDDPCRRAADHDLFLFRPRQWIMLDEESESEHRLFVNISTGRFLRRRLTLLRDHIVVSASDGLVVLRECKNPHAACVLNPFTGSLIRFAVPIRPGLTIMNVVTGSELHMFDDCDRIVFCAHPTSNFLSVQLSHSGQYELNDVQSMVTYAGDVYAADMAGSLFKIAGTVRHCFGELIAKIPANSTTSFLVESSRDLLLVCRIRGRGFKIFRVDVDQNVLQDVKNIGSRALFLGRRNLSVDANKLPSINGNCLYYKRTLGSIKGMYIYDLKNGRESRIWELMRPQSQSLTNSFSVRPTSLVQLLLRYCSSFPDVKLNRKPSVPNLKGQIKLAQQLIHV